MFHFKLFFIVLVGSIIIWFAAYRLVASTEEMTKSFSHDTGVEARAKQEAEKKNGKGKASEPTNGGSTSHGSKVSGGILTAPFPSESSADEQALVAELVAVIEEEPATQKQVDENAAVESDEQRADKQDGESGLSGAQRADSDADMQADSNNDSDSVNASQGKTRELDKKLLETIKPGDATKKTDSDTIRAVDIALALSSDSSCVIPGDNKYPRIGVHYRPSSYAIKGQSLTNIDKLIAVYKKCGGKLLIVDNKVDTEESDKNLIQLRQDEVKYYLLQRRVPKDDMIISDV